MLSIRDHVLVSEAPLARNVGRVVYRTCFQGAMR